MLLTDFFLCTHVSHFQFLSKILNYQYINILPRVLLVFCCTKGFSASFILWIAGWLRWEGTSGDVLVQFPCSPAGDYLQQVTQICVWLCFDCHQGERLHNFSGQLALVLKNTKRKEKILKFRWNFLCFSVSFPCISFFLFPFHPVL